MNKLLLSAALVASLMFASCEGESDTNNQEAAVTTENVEAITSISFEEEVFDFGSITQGEKVEHTFRFRNEGENDLVIVSAKGSCGCTVPKWPKEPIAPGEEGDIHVVFNSEGKKGMQHKKVSIIANTEPATSVIALKGEVIAPEEPTAPAESGKETGTDQPSEG